MSGNRDSFHAQLASIVEVLANTAVAEICKLVDDGYAVLRLEISQNQREIDSLRRKLLIAKIQSSRRSHLERLGALRRTGHVTRCVVKSRSNAEVYKLNGKAQATGQRRESDIPVVVKIESNRLGDTQPLVNQGCETTTVVSANSSSTSKPQSRSLRAQPESQKKNLQEHNTDRIFQSHPPPFSSQPSSENTNWESYHPISNNGGAFTCTTSCHNNNLFTNSSQWTEVNPIPGNHAGEPPRNPSPCRQGAAGTRTDGSGASEGGGVTMVSDDLGNVVPSLAGNLDWKPDVVVVGSVPIKVEEDMSSEWNIMDGDTRYAERRPQRESRKGDGERRERGMDGAHADKYSPLLLRNTADRTTGCKSALENMKTLSYGGVSSSSSSSFSTTAKSCRQVLHPQSNGGGKLAGEGPPFRCELCGKAFAKFPSLRRHQRVHTGEKPFGCRHCAKRFSHRHQMKNHERVHTGEKPFRCPVCGRCFVQSNHMKRHLSIHAAGDRAMS
ncbi:uncharacterized protein LOC139919604 [Centroberyx gerrardi]|uniref:uncharacterized protein n=1 Tax=Centroberyx gerrardi TaxID=166262 RepID=UPI003AAF974F